MTRENMCRNFLSALVFIGMFIALRPGAGAPADPPRFPANPKQAPEPPPLPPPPSSPIDYFRELLEASATKREAMLTNKSPAHRQVLEKNLRIYDQLPTDEREVRLCTMELRYHFNAVLRGPDTNRAERLRTVPDRYRQAVADRLLYWDRLAADLQQQVQDYERMMRVLMPGSVPGNAVLQLVSSNATRFQALPPSRRRQVQDSFDRIFTMTGSERTAALESVSGKLSAVEREQIEKSLAKIRTLPKAQRDLVISGFGKFSKLSPEEKRQFLRNAEVWEKMNPADRQKWRDLVAKLPPMPPMPPGFGLPPFPPTPRPLPPATALATNYPN